MDPAHAGVSCFVQQSNARPAVLWKSYENESCRFNFINDVGILKMIDWFPWAFGSIKALILGTGMFLAIKWHYDKEIKKGANKRELFSMAGKLAAIFLLSLSGLGFITFALINNLGM